VVVVLLIVEGDGLIEVQVGAPIGMGS